MCLHNAQARPATTSTSSTAPSVPPRFVAEVVPEPVADVLEAKPAAVHDAVLAQEVVEKVTRVEHDEGRGDDESDKHGRVNARDQEPWPEERGATTLGDAARHLGAAGADGGDGRRQHERAEVVLGRGREARGDGAGDEPAAPRTAGRLQQQEEGEQREGCGGHVGDRHVRVGHVQRRDREEQGGDEAGRTAEGLPADAVQQVHGRRARRHRYQPREQEVGPRVDDEGAHREGIDLAQRPQHRGGDQVHGADEIEEERRVVEELRVQTAASDAEGLGHHNALVGVDEAEGQAPSDALEAQGQRHDEHDDEQRSDHAGAFEQPGDGARVAHAPPGSSSTAAAPLAPSRKQLTSPVWQAGPAGVTMRSTVSWSQSRRAARTRCTLPLVPPLCQSSRRLRLQKCASPVDNVSASASAFA